SMTGMRMSVSSSSNAPSGRVNRSSAAAPSLAVTTWWPSSARARATSERSPSSSSAIRMRALASSMDSGHEGAPGEEADQHLMPLARRRRESRAEWHRLTGHQGVPVRQRGPAEDLVAVLIAECKSQPRYFDGALGGVDDHALDQEHRHPVLRF